MQESTIENETEIRFLPAPNVEDKMKQRSVVFKYISLFTDFTCMLLVVVWYFHSSINNDKLTIFAAMSVLIVCTLMFFKAVTKQRRTLIWLNWTQCIYIIIMSGILLKDKEPYLITVVIVWMILGVIMIYCFTTKKIYNLKFGIEDEVNESKMKD